MSQNLVIDIQITGSAYANLIMYLLFTTNIIVECT